MQIVVIFLDHYAVLCYLNVNRPKTFSAFRNIPVPAC